MTPMKKLLSLQSRLLSVWTAAALLVSLCAVPAYAAEETAAPAGSVTNVSEDGGEDCINLSAARSFQARIPVSMTEEAAAQAAGIDVPDGSTKAEIVELIQAAGV